MQGGVDGERHESFDFSPSFLEACLKYVHLLQATHLIKVQTGRTLYNIGAAQRITPHELVRVIGCRVVHSNLPNCTWISSQLEGC